MVKQWGFVCLFISAFPIWPSSFMDLKGCLSTLPPSLSSYTLVSVIICVKNFYNFLLEKICKSHVVYFQPGIRKDSTEFQDFSAVTRVKCRSEDQTELSNFWSHLQSRPSVKVSYPSPIQISCCCFLPPENVWPIFTVAHLILTCTFHLHVSLIFWVCGPEDAILPVFL